MTSIEANCIYPNSGFNSERLSHCNKDILPTMERYDAVLINIPMTFHQGPQPEGEEPPFGLARIASWVNQNSPYQCGILDAHRMQFGVSDIEQALLSSNKDNSLKVVGLNPTSVNVTAAREVADMLVQHNIPYILGGYFATLSPEEALQAFPETIGIVAGEGPIVFSEILKKLSQQETLSNLPGVYRPHESPPPQPLAPSVDPESLPQINQFEYFHKPFEYHPDGWIEASLFEATGCPFGCGFCSSPTMSNRRFKRPSTDRIVDDVHELIREGANSVHFLDDLLLRDSQDVLDLSRGFQETGILEGKFRWRGMSRANIVSRWDSDTLLALADSKCSMLAIGVESGSPRILKQIKKGISPEQVIETTTKLGSVGILTKGFFIFGFPGETVEDMKMTQELAWKMAELGSVTMSAFQLHPYPGTDVWNHLLRINPAVLTEFKYVEQSDTFDTDSNFLRKKMQATSVWLPDHVTIAEVNSGAVRRIVEETIEGFYARVRKSI